jgi:energy-converting hydrogenase Eha subunit B
MLRTSSRVEWIVAFVVAVATFVVVMTVTAVPKKPDVSEAATVQDLLFRPDFLPVY